MEEDVTRNNEITEYQDSAHPVCINAIKNSAKGFRQLQRSKEVLLKKYPRLGAKDSNPQSLFDVIIKNVFIDGVSQEVFVRNYTLDDGNDTDGTKHIYPQLGIRVKRFPQDFLSGSLPKNKTLLFKGYVSGNYFVVNSVFEQYSEDVLPYEVKCLITRYDDAARIRQAGGNFLYDLAGKAGSLNKYTKQRIQEWLDYIAWRRKIIEQRMHGARYVCVGRKDDNLVFTLRFSNLEAYESAAKWLRKNDLAAYAEKDYSDENGHFQFSTETHESREKSRPVPLGRLYSRLAKAGHEVGNHYEAELVFAIPAGENFEDMTEEQREMYVQDVILPRYPKTGFLAPLVIMDLVLYDRLERAIHRLQHDQDCYSPNLAMWIFDVKRARLPKQQDLKEWEERVGDNWLNRNVADNPNQREAIFKMLAAPDLCLIQGPPGTGKTTVIAEAIYQFARQGMRVLLASQSHDAVDNALDKLANCPEIRAVRFNKREREQGEVSKFSENNALFAYYDTLHQSTEHKFLEPWRRNRQDYRICEKELRDYRYVAADLKNMENELESMVGQSKAYKVELGKVQNHFNLAYKEIQEHENARQQYQRFQGAVEQDNLSGGEFYLPPVLVDVVVPLFAAFVQKAIGQGVILVAGVTQEVMRREPKTAITMLAKDCKVLFSLRDKLVRASREAPTDAGIVKLKMKAIETQIYEIGERMNDEGDKEKWDKLKAERNRLRNEKEKLNSESGIFVLTDVEADLLDEEIKGKVQTSEGRDDIARLLDTIEEEYRSTLQASVEQMTKVINSYRPQDTNALSEKLKSIQGKIKQLNEEIQSMQQGIVDKKKLVVSLAQKYGCAQDEIESCITEKIKHLAKEWEDDASI